ncbi:Recombinase [Gemmatirosa kalamazoonensis]|uniref:Recombinase n=2 Tax=Gemmatirosa kalamazoonensis TaxID=861299 RepID=W0RLW5_9BACT|nr:Recombinase [Gemmatirosa kalamazoonensis]
MLPPLPVALYTRKSSVEDSKQVASHEQQRAAILALHDIPEYFPGTSVRAWWQDSGTGSSFDTRPGIIGFLREVAEKYPQPPDAPGRLFIYDESRFSRALKNGQVDLHASQEMQIRFARLGWQIVFINRPPTGNAVMDAVMDTLAFAQASDYLVKLSASVKRGKAHWGQSGYWLGGPPPFPARRVEAITGRPLADGVKATERTVLEADPAKVEHWNHGAEMLLAGRTVMDVVRYFSENVPNSYPKRKGEGTHWTYTTVQKMYTNRALIGELRYRLSGELIATQARWAPVVDVDLFLQVNAELARRQRPESSRVGRRNGSRFVLQLLRCAKCGSGYKGTTLGGRRYYVHYQAKEPYLRGAALHRAEAGGCRSFTVDAEQLERLIRDAIVAFRCSAEARVAVLSAHRTRVASASAERSAVMALQSEEARLAAEYDNLREALRATRDADLRKDLIADAGGVRAKLERLRFELQAAITRQTTVEGATDAVGRTIDESARIAAEWDEVSTNDRQALFDLWVEDVLIEIDHQPGKRWASAKRAFVCLAVSPNELHQRRRPESEIPAWYRKQKGRKHLACGPFMCGDAIASPRCRSNPARGCPRG